MTMDLSEANHVVGMWFVCPAMPGDTGSDWMACAWRMPDADVWEMEGRIRVYNDEQGRIFDSDDHKQWFSNTYPVSEKTEEDIIEMLSGLARTIALAANGSFDFIKGGCSGKEFAEKLQNDAPDYIHVKKVEKGSPEYNKYVGDQDANA